MKDNQLEFKPYVGTSGLAELTLRSVFSGTVLGIVFGAANAYLGLKAGLTISTSIPVAVLTVVFFNVLGRRGGSSGILEANLSQTIGSASSSVASGVIFTVPALYLWGMKPSLVQLTLLAMAGGVLGVLAMIPLRRYLIKAEHGTLPYPEGVACAEVLKATETKDGRGAIIFWGLGFGMLVKWLTGGLKWIASAFSLPLPAKIHFGIDVSPALVGVGYILGVRVATVMVAGGALASFVLIPVIGYWGQSLTTPFYPETELLISQMSAGQIWNRYIRYIGAGAVAAGGILTLIRSVPTMWDSFKIGLRHLAPREQTADDRLDRDLSFRTIGMIIAAIVSVLVLTPGLLGFIESYAAKLVTAALIVVFAFFFVTVSSRIVGLVGVSSNPTSGMTIATLLGTSLVFYWLGWTDLAGKATALIVGTCVCVASSIAGDTSQDLKTGFLLGATPRLQQLGELLGVTTSAFFVCATVYLLDQSFGLGSAELPAPQATLMNLVITGVLEQNLPWFLIGIGAAIALVAAVFKVPVLAFAVGIYLPLEVMTPVFLGGALRYFLQRGQSEAAAATRENQGILFASGLVGGEGLMGVLFAGWVVLHGGARIQGYPLGLSPAIAQAVALAAVCGILWVVAGVARRRFS